MALTLRAYRDADAASTLAVFLRSVHGLAGEHYSPRQLAAWAPLDRDPIEWAEARRSANTRVALCDGRVVGFTDVDPVGYIDMLFVDPDAARRGVASALLRWAGETARASGAVRLTTHASLTAEPFFTAKGFSIDEVRHPVVRGVEFVNYGMSRAVAG